MFTPPNGGFTFFSRNREKRRQKRMKDLICDKASSPSLRWVLAYAVLFSLRSVHQPFMHCHIRKPQPIAVSMLAEKTTLVDHGPRVPDIIF